MLARRFRVKETIPWFDGALLDNIVDYLTYVFAPIVLLWTTGHLPEGAAGWVVASLPLLASCYQFCRVDAKTDDHFFLGFPSYWNVVAFYVIVLDTGDLVDGRDAARVRGARVRADPLPLPVPDARAAGADAGAQRSSGWSPYAVLVVQLPDPNPWVVAVSPGLHRLLRGAEPLADGPGRRCPAGRPLSRRAARATDRSATRSAVSSMPQDSRTKPGATASPPHCARRSSVLCTPPKLVAAAHSRLAPSSRGHGGLVGELAGQHAVGAQHLPRRQVVRGVARAARASAAR